MKILLLAPRFPLPAVKGDKLRTLQMVRLLREAHEVTLATFVHAGEERRRLGEMERLCRVVAWPGSNVARAWRAGRGIFSALPLQVAMHDSPTLRRSLAPLFDKADVIHCTTLRVACLVPPQWPGRIVVDFVDAISHTFADWPAGAVLGWALAREAKRLRAYETKLAQRADLALAVTDEDVARLGGHTAVLPLAVDTQAFCPPAQGACREGVVFTGHLRYAPNIEAAMWLVREVFPRIRAVIPQATLRIVGAGAGRAVRALKGPGVEVRGFVDDMASVLKAAAVAVAPIHHGAGIKTKVLEAMACATPVVATALANSGIRAQDGHAILLANTPQSFAEAVIGLLLDPARADAIGAAGRAHVEERFSVPVIGRQLLDLYATLAANRRASL